MIKKLLKKFFPYLVKLKRSFEEITLIFNMELENIYKERAAVHKNPFVLYGETGFSQSDEDGLTKEIIKRLGIVNGSFAEFGVGTGIENNTLVLLALGWRGFWVGGESLDFNIEKSTRLSFQNQWVTKDNIVDLYNKGLYQINEKSVDVISIDLDGNDYYFCNQLLKSGVSPSLFIVEYNARFAPPIKFVIDYDKNHNWDSSDYYGASLQSFVDLFTKYQYRLICCNAATGVNAFFVKDINIHLFPEVPDDIEDIYTSPFFILHSGFLMPKSPKTFESIIK